MKNLLGLFAGAAALGTVYLVWRRRDKSGFKAVGADGKYMFDASLPSHIQLPTEPVHTGVEVELGDEYRKDRMRHLVISRAVSPAHLKALLPVIKELFVPQKVILPSPSLRSFKCAL